MCAGYGPGPLLATDPEQLRNFYPGSISLIGDLANINVVCPAGYHSSGCIGGTVPAGIGNLQLSGGLSTEFASGPGLLRDRPEVTEGFNKYTGCGATVRFNYPIPSDYLRQSDKVFVKVEAYCAKEKYAPPSNYHPPVYKPTPPIHKPTPPVYHPPVYNPPIHKPYDPCSCADAKHYGEHLGCASWNVSHALGAPIGERICYVGRKCPGFWASEVKYGSYWKFVPRHQCYHPTPPPVHKPTPPVYKPTPPIHKPTPPVYHPPVYNPPVYHPPHDPCDCRRQVAPLGCIGTESCHTGTVCYVSERCPGFSASQNSQRIGQFYKCVAASECR